MDTAWIQVFVLTLSECVAPAGKTVCQEQELQMQFVEQAECELALEQLISLKDEAKNVIVYKDRSQCAPSARQQSVYRTLTDVNEKLAAAPDWLPPEVSDQGHEHLRRADIPLFHTLTGAAGTMGLLADYAEARRGLGRDRPDD